MENFMLSISDNKRFVNIKHSSSSKMMSLEKIKRVELLIVILIFCIAMVSCDQKDDTSQSRKEVEYEPTLYDIPDEGKIIEYKGSNIVVVRDANKVYALSMRCSKKSCFVEYSPKNRTFTCPCDGNVYSISGKLLKGSISYGLDRYKVVPFGSSNVKIEVDTRYLYDYRNTLYEKAFIEISPEN